MRRAVHLPKRHKLMKQNPFVIKRKPCGSMRSKPRTSTWNARPLRFGSVLNAEQVNYSSRRKQSDQTANNGTKKSVSNSASTLKPPSKTSIGAVGLPDLNWKPTENFASQRKIDTELLYI